LAATGYVVIDPIVAYTASNFGPPYARRFGIPDAPFFSSGTLDRDPVLLMSVKTRYSATDIGSAASVHINDGHIGFIRASPAPDESLYFSSLDLVSFVVNRFFLTPWVFPVNILTVTPAPDDQQPNGLLVGNVTLLYSLAT
jgi:hypothetical protein